MIDRWSRRHAREGVLMTLYQMEFYDGDCEYMLQFALQELEAYLAESATPLPEDMVNEGPASFVNEDDLAFARQLVRGVVRRKEEIDDILATFSRDWSLARIARLERSILRLALYELLWCDDIPPAATLDEAVELAKAYCPGEAARFINGILGNIHQHLKELRNSEGRHD